MRLALASLFMITVNVAYGCVTVVYPTGTNPTDVQNVQAALNQGGSVLLKAVDKNGHPQYFNFGSWPEYSNGVVPPNSEVHLVTSVAISGEQVGCNRTTIVGGVSPFYETSTTVKASITGLKFVNPLADAITIYGSSGISIVNNEVDGVLPFYRAANNWTETLGFFVGGLGNSTITGNVVISGNYIHGLHGSQYEFGFEAYQVESPMTITGNTIEVADDTTAGDGLYDSEGIAVDYCSGASTISCNNISVGPGVCYNGILVQGPANGATSILANEVSIDEPAFCYAAIGVSGSTGTAQVLGNLIDSKSESADGIALEGTSSTGTVTGATVSLNGICIENSDVGAIGIYGAVNKSCLSLNLISGESAYALSASSDGNASDLASSNSFLNNLLLCYTATDASIFLDTNTVNNVVRGCYSSVINKGTGNQISH